MRKDKPSFKRGCWVGGSSGRRTAPFGVGEGIVSAHKARRSLPLSLPDSVRGSIPKILRVAGSSKRLECSVPTKGRIHSMDGTDFKRPELAISGI
jgi:hypothetical protein